jgi:hypothetical protein
MDFLYELNRWQWALIGLLAGLALGGSRVAWGPAYRDSAARTLTQQLFEQAVLGRPGEWGSRLTLTDLVAHPADQWGDQWVTGRFCEESDVRDSSGKFVRTRMRGDFKYRATIPYHPLLQGNAVPAAYPSVRDFLRAAGPNSQRPDKCAYAWQEHTWSALGLWTAGAVLLVGGIWPTVLGLVTGAGWGRQPREKPAIDLSRVAPTRSQPPTPPRVAEDQAQLIAVTEQMENELAQEPEPPAPPPSPASPPAPAPQLSGQAVEAPAQPTEADKEYGGEFYPTVAHAPGKKEEQSGS